MEKIGGARGQTVVRLEFYDNGTYAIGIYDKAIQLGNITGGAYSEALAAKQRLLKNQ